MRECIGINNNREELDFYTTNPLCVKDIMGKENITNKYILENSAGTGNISNILKEKNNVFNIDIIDRNILKLDYIGDFLQFNQNIKFDLAVYNPPFKLSMEFINHTWNFTDRQIIFQRLQFLESKKRLEQIFQKGYLEKMYIYSTRQITNDNMKANSMCFCWFVLDKNNKNKPVIDWI